MSRYRQRLWEHALGNYGFVTSGDARDLGIPGVELPKLASREGLTHISYGVYRFDDAPTSPYDQFYEAVLRVGDGAHLTGDAVLSLHGLALVNPRRIRIGLPRRTQAKLPDWIQIIRQTIPAQDLTTYEGIPSTTVARALLDCRDIVMGERLIEALADAVSQGLVSRRERRHVEQALTGTTP